MKLSIITICRNEAKEIEDTCKSVAIQTYKHFEWIVIDGESSDGTLDILEKYKEKMSHFISERDKGIYYAMNKGIHLAQGEYLLFLNGGDYLENARILEEVFSKNFTSDIIYGNEKFILSSEDKKRFYILKTGPKKMNAYYFLHNFSLRHQSTFIKKDLFQKFGLYDVNYRSAADIEMFIRFIFKHKSSYDYINKTISCFKGYDGMSTDLKLKQVGIGEIREIHKKYFSGKEIRFYKIQSFILFKIKKHLCNIGLLIFFFSPKIRKKFKKIKNPYKVEK